MGRATSRRILMAPCIPGIWRTDWQLRQCPTRLRVPWGRPITAMMPWVVAFRSQRTGQRPHSCSRWSLRTADSAIHVSTNALVRLLLIEVSLKFCQNRPERRLAGEDHFPANYTRCLSRRIRRGAEQFSSERLCRNALEAHCCQCSMKSDVKRRDDGLHTDHAATDQAS
jgi:hypothetical protein